MKLVFKVKKTFENSVAPFVKVGSELMFKARETKYVKRTGGPGAYKYWYKNPTTGKLEVGKKGEPKGKGKEEPGDKKNPGEGESKAKQILGGGTGKAVLKQVAQALADGSVGNDDAAASRIEATAEGLNQKNKAVDKKDKGRKKEKGGEDPGRTKDDTEYDTDNKPKGGKKKEELENKTEVKKSFGFKI